jgi:hypothetical protein
MLNNTDVGALTLNECLIPEDVIEWALNNESVWQEAEQLGCRLVADVFAEDDGPVNGLRLCGPYNRKVVDYALRVAAKSHFPVYWIFNKGVGNSNYKNTAKSVDSGNGSGAQGSEGEGEGRGGGQDQGGGEDGKGKTPGDGSDPPENSNSKGISEGQTYPRHRMEVQWQHPMAPGPFFTSKLTLYFESDESEVKRNRRDHLLSLSSDIRLRPECGYKIGLGSSVSFFTNGPHGRSIDIM